MVSTKRNLMTATTVHLKTMIMKYMATMGGIEEIESDGSEENLVQDQEEPSVEDSGNECNNGLNDKPSHVHFPKEVEKLWK